MTRSPLLWCPVQQTFTPIDLLTDEHIESCRERHGGDVVEFEEFFAIVMGVIRRWRRHYRLERLCAEDYVADFWNPN